jgi:hypothetical protein
MIDEVSNGNGLSRGYLIANKDAVKAAVAGRGPDSSNADTDYGARAVANISSTHIPEFVRLSLTGDPKPYKNGYDLKRYRVGDPPPGETLKTREMVDRSLPIDGKSPEEIYFCAVDLNGVGVRFYGDVSLVIRKDQVNRNTVVLDRNSYDLVRAPIADQIAAEPPNEQDSARRREALRMSGRWEKDLPDIAAIKVLGELGSGVRRLTTGRISDAVLTDEDYIEVLRIGSFGSNDLHEARVAVADAAHETLIGERLRAGPTPRHEALLWRQRRREADAALQRANVISKVVATTGRVKS